MNPEALQDIKEIAYRNADNESYSVFLATTVWKAIPQNIKDKLTKDKDGNVVVNDADALSILQGVLPNIIGEEELKNKIESTYKDKDLDLQELYDLMTFEELKDVVKEEKVQLIAEADTEEEVKDTTKDLTDILNKDAVPNILKVIASTVQKEVKKSNEELEKMELLTIIQMKITQILTAVKAKLPTILMVMSLAIQMAIRFLVKVILKVIVKKIKHKMIQRLRKKRAQQQEKMESFIQK